MKTAVIYGATTTGRNIRKLYMGGGKISTK